MIYLSSTQRGGITPTHQIKIFDPPLLTAVYKRTVTPPAVGDKRQCSVFHTSIKVETRFTFRSEISKSTHTLSYVRRGYVVARTSLRSIMPLNEVVFLSNKQCIYIYTKPIYIYTNSSSCRHFAIIYT